jgi:hypothetical protein
VTPPALWIVAVVPPTDVELRVREMQRTAFRRLGLPGGLALPVMIPLEARTETDAHEPSPGLPSGRLEAPRLVPGACAVRHPWLLWTVHGEGGDTNCLRPGGREPYFPGEAGFPLAFSVSPEALESGRALLDAAASSPFQPRAIGLYRVHSLGGTEPTTARVAATLWEWLFGNGLVWEEVEVRPLRRRRQTEGHPSPGG